MILLLAAIIFVAAAIRVAACTDQFWFDEILSWSLAGKCKTVLDVFSLHHDNNNYINTIWLFLVGQDCQNWFIYRVPALLAGISVVGLMCAVADKRGRSQMVLAALLGALSYMLVVYSSEARGYSLAMAGALLCVWLLQRFFDKRAMVDNIGFCIAACLGILSNLTFVMVFWALLGWTAYHLVAVKKLHAAWLEASRLFAIPMVVLAAIYFFDVRLQVVGGGIYMPWYKAVGDAFGAVDGLSPGSAFIPAIVLVSVSALIYECWCLYKEKSDIWVFYAFVLFISPALAIWLLHPPYLYPRHFAICAPFLLLVYADVLVRLYEKRAGKFIAVAALLVFTVPNVQLVKLLFSDGRGHYGQALEFMAEHTAAPSLTVGCPVDIQGYLPCLFYQKRQPVTKPITFVPRSGWSAMPPEWIIEPNQDEPFGDWAFMRADGPYAMPQTARLPFGTYRLVRIYHRSAKLSGFNWCLYQRAGSGPGAGSRPARSGKD